MVFDQSCHYLGNYLFAQMIKKGKGRYRKLVITTIILLWTLLGMRTIIRNSNWHDPITFYTHLLKFSESARVYNNLGMAYADEGDHSQATFHYGHAINLADIYPQTHYNLAISQAALGKTGQAVNSFKKVIEMGPYFAPAYDKLIQLHLDHHQTEKALEVVDQAIKVFPQDSRYPALRNEILLEQGRGKSDLSGLVGRVLKGVP
jgi:tetratricopeptide (TPR) repeat protein